MTAPAGVFPSGTPNLVASGTLQALNSAVTVSTDTLSAIGASLVGANAGATVVFEGTINGTTWDTIKVYPLTVGSAGVTSATAAGDFEFNCAAFKQVRARLSVAGSGSFTVTLNGTAALKHVGVKNGNAADLNATVTPAGATLTDHSGSISTGGAAQQLMAANASRHGWRLMNTSTADLWFNDTGGMASVGGAGCYRVASLGYYETPVGGASQAVISIYGATSAQTFSASDW
jgi:hypothetical protein